MEASAQSADILGTAARLRAGSLSSLELTRQYLARIAARDSEFGSYLHVNAEHALGRAALADKELANGLDRGPLHGIPLAAKDLFDTAFAPTTVGTAVFAGRQPATDATVIARLLEAGAVILGKLTMTEGAFSSHHPSIAAPRNPLGPELWVGPSSTGSGVAVAADLCLGALGSDTGGSIRLPSATCGLTGLKPTWGRVSRHGAFPLADSLDHIGPMAHTVADCAALLQAIAGADPADPTSLHADVPDYLAACGAPISGLTVGIDRRYALAGIDSEVASALEAAVETLTALGVRVVAIEAPESGDLAANWVRLCAVETAVIHAGTYPSRASEYGPELAGMIESGLRAKPATITALNKRRRTFTEGMSAVLAGVDCMLIPTLPFPIPTAARMEGRDGPAPETQDLLRFTAPFDFSGHPTLCLPNGRDRRGLPLSMQLVGSALSEATLIRMGDAFQRATDWHRLAI
ncbi:amidase [Caulobacter sp. KR2-114]|uniref:amidase n=1 Tax=Caulobacter sp. KR2-114 TaxID=3400912 RepID=UPI003C000EE7